MKITQEIDQCKHVSSKSDSGYVIIVSVILIEYITIVPMSAFGILYGQFLASVGDETTGTEVVLGTFIATMSFTGIIASPLLQKYTYRTVGLIGIFIFSLGAFIEIFSSIFYMFVFCAFMKGIGYGILDPTSYSVLNSHFDRKYSVVMGILHGVISIGLILCSMIMTYLVENFGFWKTLCIQSAITLLGFPAVATFNLRKNYKTSKKLETSQTHPSSEVDLDLQRYSLLDDSKKERRRRSTIVNENFIPVILTEETSASVSESGIKNWLVNTVGLKWFLLPKYMNIAVGLAVTWSCEASFSSLLRVNLNNLNYSSYDIAKMSMVFFASDLLAKLCFSVVSGLCLINNRYLFLVTMLLLSLSRTAFTFRDGYVWRTITLTLVGLLNGLMNTSLVLVISQQYKENFATPFCLYKLLTGMIYLITGGVAKTIPLLQRDTVEL
ncbi:monocarboxylate transporter 9 [Leptinotarsa decemlineata]|uniref:monocarboxylate transporter 9 n=1 Tax=Leptinotarsa decemlineata TaxID=7539 RepID=UPI003D30D071